MSSDTSPKSWRLRIAIAGRMSFIEIIIDSNTLFQPITFYLMAVRRLDRIFDIRYLTLYDLFCWYVHVEKKDVEDWVSKCRRLEVEGCRGMGRPKKT